MTVQTPPYVLQSGSHSAQLFRQAISTLLGSAGGVVAANSGLAVTQNGSPNMSVNVAGGVPNGQIWIPGTTSAGVQALYYGFNDASVNLVIAAADPTNPRIDTLIAQAEDAAYAGANNDWKLAVVAGTPTAGANLVNLNGKGAVPASSLVIAYVLVGAGVTSIVSANISYVALTAFGSSVAGGGAAPLVTALPTSPTDGQLIDFLASSTNGVVWRFRYRAASASTFKWEFVGGPPLYSEVATLESTTSVVSYAALTTAGPSVTLPTLPNGGDFDVAHGALMQADAGSLNVMSYDIGGTGAVDADGVRVSTYTAGTGQVDGSSVARTRRKTGLAGGISLTAKYRAGSSDGNATWANRFMSVLPVRVG